MSRIRKGLRYGTVGLIATIVHTAIAVGWIRVLDGSPAWANGWAFLVASAVSYMLNTHWSFASTHTPARLSRFLVVNTLCLLVAVGVAKAVEYLGGHYMAGIFATALTVPWVGFLLHQGWTYRDRR